MKTNLQGLTFEEVVDLLDLYFSKLDLNNNFEGFEKTVEIQANSTISIRNNLTFTPSRYIILSQEGNGLITKSKGLDSSGFLSKEWDTSFVYLKNNGNEKVTATVYFLK